MAEETKDYMPTADEYYKQFERAVMNALKLMLDKHWQAKESIVVYASAQHVTPLLAAAADIAWKKVFNIDLPEQEKLHPDGAVAKAFKQLGTTATFEIWQKPFPACDGEYVSYDFTSRRDTRFFYDMSPCEHGQSAFERLRREGGHL